MGISAAAVYGGTRFDYVYTESDQDARRLFASANAIAVSEGSVDVLLEKGGLHVAPCLKILMKAGQRNVDGLYDGEVWGVADVQTLADSTTWKFEDLDDRDRQFVPCVREFVLACASGGYGIQFDL